MKNFALTLTAIGCITGIELFALSKGIDGVALSASIAVISGLGGYTASEVVKFFKSRLK